MLPAPHPSARPSRPARRAGAPVPDHLIPSAPAPSAAQHAPHGLASSLSAGAALPGSGHAGGPASGVPGFPAARGPPAPEGFRKRPLPLPAHAPAAQRARVGEPLPAGGGGGGGLLGRRLGSGPDPTAKLGERGAADGITTRGYDRVTWGYDVTTLPGVTTRVSRARPSGAK
jgi:hypothetical protein